MEEVKHIEQTNRVTHSVRISQAVIQYGVGAMIDFPDQTLMTAAPEYWEGSIRRIHDERLEKALHVDSFGMPDSMSENGVAYARFPEYYFCPKCRRLKPIKDWMNEYSTSQNCKKQYETDPYMARHMRCPQCKQELVVARIVVVCQHGHIDDFPWINWTHAKAKRLLCSNPELRLLTSSSAGDGLEGIAIQCSCGARATLKGAFQNDAFEVLEKDTEQRFCFRCTGRHPWKNSYKKCDKYPVAMQRGGSSVYFPLAVSSLVIPPYSSKLTAMIQNSNAFNEGRIALTNGIKMFKNYIKEEFTQEIRQSIIEEHISTFSEKIALEIAISKDKIKSVLERKWKTPDEEEEEDTIGIKYRMEEYKALSGEVVLDDPSGDFVREETNIEEYNLPFVKQISLLHKLREVQALIGFSRIRPADTMENNAARMAYVVPIKEKETTWYPGYEVRGEGIFIEFDNDIINLWRTENQWAKKRAETIQRRYMQSYFGNNSQFIVTSKYLFLHTLAHLLIKQLSFECGYSIASLKERIYCSEASEGLEMSGFLIYTASGDAEGTLGGLVRQGRADVFTHIFNKALRTASTCSYDPVCSLSIGQGRDALNLASCASCSLIPETSCEKYNCFLDRGVLLGTFQHPNAGLFSEYLKGKSVRIRENKQLSQKEIASNILVYDGIDCSSESYFNIWDNIEQFCDNEKEKKLLELFKADSRLFEKKEKPLANAKVKILHKNDVLSVDLVWMKSKTIYCSAESEEEYRKLQTCNWKCYFGPDMENIDQFLSMLEDE